MLKIKTVTILILVSFLFEGIKIVNAQEKSEKKKISQFYPKKSKWVDSVFNSLSMDEKISQLLFTEVQDLNDDKTLVKTSDNIFKYKIGGLIVTHCGPNNFVNKINTFQDISKTPLLVGIHLLSDLNLPVDSLGKFPQPLTMGFVKDENIIYDHGAEMARQCARLGIHLIFGQLTNVLDNQNDSNLVTSSFGENKYNVAKQSISLVRGIQSQNVITIASGFPCYLPELMKVKDKFPILDYSMSKLDSVDLYVYKELIRSGLLGIGGSAYNVPAFDTTSNLPVYLSKKTIQDYIRNSHHFKGIVFTPTIDISDNEDAEKIIANALAAGNDVLVLKNNIPLAVNLIKKALGKKLLSWIDINNKCKKVICAKYWVGLDTIKPNSVNYLMEDINNEEAEYSKRKINENSISLIKNVNEFVPIKYLEKSKIASISFGENDVNIFQHYLSYYADIKSFASHPNLSPTITNAILEILSKYDIVVVSIHKLNNNKDQYFGFNQSTINFIEKLSKQSKVILNIFGNPFSIDVFKNLDQIKAMLISNEDNDIARLISAQIIFGGIPASGNLSVTPYPMYNFSKCLTTRKTRLKYSIAKDVAVNTRKLLKIDTLVYEAIDNGAMPGCQVIAAKDGVVFFNKNYGYHTYDKDVPVGDLDLYDLASVTKVVATTLTMMKLKDEGKFNLNDELSKYIPGLDTTDKSEITFKEALSHYSKLPAWMPFYLKTFKDKTTYSLREDIYDNLQSDKFPLPVAENLFITREYSDTIYRKIFKVEQYPKKEARYSDIGFYLLRKAAENMSNTKFDRFLDSSFYKPLGAYSLCFNPLNKFEKQQIVPTENDTIFRKQMLQGHVHDQGAALLGGVSGHAGLFGNANDLAKFLQMLLQNGEYGGIKFLSEKTIDEFTSRPYRANKNRRALGFDKPLTRKKNKENGPCSKYATDKSYGHSGFTGTFLWADPETQIVYVFLCNRIYPNTSNNKIVQMNTRTNVQDVLYEALEEKKYEKLTEK